MRAIRNWSIKTKLVVLSVVSVGVLRVSCAGVTVSEICTMRSFKMESLRAQAGMLAFNSTGVLSLTTSRRRSSCLAGLQSQPTVEFACLYDTARPGPGDLSGGRDGIGY